jgi:RHS repeat-associated protein
MRIWLVYDGGGSVRQLTSAAGAVTDTYNYDAFGNLLNSTGTTPNNYRYRGEQYDQDLGLYYLRARYYNPQTGRFLSRDPEDGTPYDPKSLHKYLYAGGDPVNATDRSGLATLVEYRFNIGGRVFSIAVHSAVHPFLIFGETYYCIHIQLLTYLAGMKGSDWRYQFPLPWCH